MGNEVKASGSKGEAKNEYAQRFILVRSKSKTDAMEKVGQLLRQIKEGT